MRFFERIHTDSIASERGIYKLTRKTKTTEQNYFGQFHVLLIKEEGKWKILMDYDSTENKLIGENDYLKAFDINHFTPFISPIKKAP